ncbi:MAG TPA: helix-turn-helix domain-containing protein [Actinomycetota bacterium]
MSDREVQDTIITALADARFRGSPEWIDRRLADGERVERFARFLARHFYYERVVHFFKYSRALARVTGRRPDAVLRGDAFEVLLPRVVLGSRETAREVAELVVRDQLGADHEAVPYFEDLLRYQEAMMVVEAGPRDWSAGTDPTTPVEAGALAQIVEGTTVLELDHDLPAVLPSLLAPWEEPPSAPRRGTTLVVARTPQARVSVVKADPVLVGLLREVERPWSARELADRAGLEPSATEALLRDLAGVGAVRFSIGS